MGLVSLVECGVIRTTARDPLPSRLHEIYEGVTELLARHKPDALSVEDVFYAKNVRTTIVMGHARGAVLFAASRPGSKFTRSRPPRSRRPSSAPARPPRSKCSSCS